MKKDGTAYCLCNADCSKTAKSGPICAKNGKDYPHLKPILTNRCAVLAEIPFLKVINFHKQIFLFLFEPKTEQNHVMISVPRI